MKKTKIKEGNKKPVGNTKKTPAMNDKKGRGKVK
jgi:hypothetical protein